MPISKIGTITIGQAPRADITPILDAALPPHVTAVHSGILDGLSDEQIAARFPPGGGGEGEPVLTSRLLDGRAVVMGKAAVHRAVQLEIDRLATREGCQVVVLLCTGEFHGLECPPGAWLLEPDKVLLPALEALVGRRRAGVLVPLGSQVASEVEKWKGLQRAPVFAVASPYTAAEGEVAAAARTLVESGAEVILTDCMGYTAWHREVCRRETEVPVVLSNQFLADILKNML
ncbi:uncharacterized protein E0L32_003136 [Thyridium curvatum]|uniref:AroM protein n=1 Tax=Thyridium curvatum TaxID=1093900 RepID=A0A507BD79_9PEZI|nr:uncharacterized protein E0L32_003136 [Thyridium curvatum]TPX17493.1 hypothetical protein E0L32_003136 [Thyridium curvatum]